MECEKKVDTGKLLKAVIYEKLNALNEEINNLKKILKFFMETSEKKSDCSDLSSSYVE